MGLQHMPRLSGRNQFWTGIAVGSGIGFYDGFFGPGTGSFLVFLFVRLFGFDFLRASVGAKLVNVACNLSALSWFAWEGHVIWQLGLLMAFFNIVGSAVGSRLALRRGNGFVRKVFLVVVTFLIAKTSYDAYLA